MIDWYHFGYMFGGNDLIENAHLRNFLTRVKKAPDANEYRFFIYAKENFGPIFADGLDRDRNIVWRNLMVTKDDEVAVFFKLVIADGGVEEIPRL